LRADAPLVKLLFNPFRIASRINDGTNNHDVSVDGVINREWKSCADEPMIPAEENRMNSAKFAERIDFREN